MKIKLLVEGGEMKPGPALSQKLGPAGINIGQVIQKINEATSSFKGLKVPAELDVDTSSKTFSIEVFSPPASGLLKRELGIEKGSGIQKKMNIANASIEQIISVAKQKLPNMLCRDLKSAVKTIAGTCVSLGILIENKPAVEAIREIEKGKYDREIKEERTQTSSDKKIELDKYFKEVKEAQEKLLQQEKAAAEAAAAEAEAKKALAGTPVAATGTTEIKKEPEKAKEEKPLAKPEKK
ncbi:MAG: 50S ribosomal protein L11 [Nanoarchaeota archaeon]